MKSEMSAALREIIRAFGSELEDYKEACKNHKKYLREFPLSPTIEEKKERAYRREEFREMCKNWHKRKIYYNMRITAERANGKLPKITHSTKMKDAIKDKSMLKASIMFLKAKALEPEKIIDILGITPELYQEIDAKNPEQIDAEKHLTDEIDPTIGEENI